MTKEQQISIRIIVEDKRHQAEKRNVGPYGDGVGLNEPVEKPVETPYVGPYGNGVGLGE